MGIKRSGQTWELEYCMFIMHLVSHIYLLPCLSRLMRQ